MNLTLQVLGTYTTSQSNKQGDIRECSASVTSILKCLCTSNLSVLKCLCTSNLSVLKCTWWKREMRSPNRVLDTRYAPKYRSSVKQNHLNKIEDWKINHSWHKQQTGMHSHLCFMWIIPETLSRIYSQSCNGGVPGNDGCYPPSPATTPLVGRIKQATALASSWYLPDDLSHRAKISPFTTRVGGL